MDAGREVWQGLADLAGLLLVVIATGGVCCQPRGWSGRVGKGDIFRKQRREFEGVKRGRNRRSGDQDGNCRGMGGICGNGGSSTLAFRWCPIELLPRAERGSGQGPSPARKGKGCQARKGTAMLSTVAAGQTPLLVG